MQEVERPHAKAVIVSVKMQPVKIRPAGAVARHEQFPEAVAMARLLRRASPKTGERMSLRKISAELATSMSVARPSVKSILAMIEGPMPESAKINYLGSAPRQLERAASRSGSVSSMKTSERRARTPACGLSVPQPSEALRI
jgi:hypothetical protein